RHQTQQEKYFSEERKRAEYAVLDAKRAALVEGVGIIKGFLKESALAYKAFLAVEKALAVAEIVTRKQAEIAGYYAKYALLPGGALIASGLAAAARIRSGISIATVVAQGIKEIAGFEDGGYSAVDY